MTSSDVSESRSRLRITDYLAIVLFVVCLPGWCIAYLGLCLIIKEWREYPDPGDAAIGMTVVGTPLLFISVCLLGVSLLVARTHRLPLWFRIFQVIGPAFGSLAGATFLFRAMMH